MEQDRFQLFPILLSVAMVVMIGVLTLLFISTLFIPAWQEFLNIESPWYCSLFILFLCPLIGFIRLPVAIRFNGIQGSANMLSTIVPLAILAYTYPSSHINWSPFVYVPGVLSFILYWICSMPSERGTYLYRISILIGSVSSILIIQAFVGSNLQAFLWIAFASQFLPLLLVETIRTSQSTKLYTEDEEFVLGGKGAHDPLWVAPSFAIFLTYSTHLLFWGLKTPPFG